MLDFLQANQATHCISGMALGVDTVFAIATLNYKKANPEKEIILECAIPCRNHSSRWKKVDKDLYDKILKRADMVTLVSNTDYKPWVMQKRNEYMVDHCDLLLGIWDGSNSGTGHCIKYAKKQGKQIQIVHPSVI